VTTKKRVATFALPRGHSLALSLDGQSLAIDGLGTESQLWNVATGKVAAVLPSDYPVEQEGPLSFSPDGRILAHAAINKPVGTQNTSMVQLWDVATAMPIIDLFTPPAADAFSTPEFNSLAISPDGKTLAAGGQGSDKGRGSAEIMLWDMNSGGLVATLTSGTPDPTEYSNNQVISMAFSPDGKILASSTEIASLAITYTGVWLWDPVTHHLITTLTGSGGGTVAFSPNGKMLAFGGVDGDSVQLWDVAARQMIGMLNLGQQPDGSASYSGGQTFSPDGKSMAVPVGSTIEIWSISQ
jgi:WD40 repeat protein